jgi:hypothetical protein
MMIWAAGLHMVTWTGFFLEQNQFTGSREHNDNGRLLPKHVGARIWNIAVV